MLSRTHDVLHLIPMLPRPVSPGHHDQLISWMISTPTSHDPRAPVSHDKPMTK